MSGKNAASVQLSQRIARLGERLELEAHRPQELRNHALIERILKKRRSLRYRLEMLSKLGTSATLPEITEQFVETGEYLLHETERPYHKRNQRRIKRLQEKQRSLWYMLEHLGEESYGPTRMQP